MPLGDLTLAQKRFLDRLVESDLVERCRKKFGWPGLTYLLQTAFLGPEHFTSWVETDPPVSLEEARPFFRELARSLVRSAQAEES